MRALALVIALAAVAAADEIKHAETSVPPSAGDVKRVRFIGADTTPTQAGALEGGASALAFSPDGKWLASAGANGAVGVTLVAESADGWHRVLGHLGAATGVAFVARSNGLAVVSVGDDETLRFASIAADLGVVSSASRALGLGPLTGLAVLDATHVAVASARGSVAVVRIGDSLTTERTVTLHDGAIAALVALGPSRFATAGWDGTVRLVDATTGREFRSAKVSAVELTTLAASPDGKTLAVGSWKKGIAFLDATNLKSLGNVTPHKGATSAALLVGAPKGALEKCRLVTASLSDECLSVSEALGAKLELRARRTRITTVPSGALAVSPDGTLIACATNDGGVGLYDVEDRK